MKEAVIYFYKLEGQSAKKGFLEKPVIKLEDVQMTENIRLIKIGIPEYYYKKKNWKNEKLVHEIGKSLSLISENIIYRVADNKCQELINLPKERVPWEVIEFGLNQLTDVEGLLILEGEEEETRNIVTRFAPHLNFLGIQTESDYEEMEEHLFEEYGLNIHLGVDAVKFFIPPMKKMLVIDMGVTSLKLLKRLPEGTIYFDVQSDEMKKMRILAKRNDIQYIAILDTIRKNGYNT